MAEITLLQSQWLWYSGGKSGVSAVVGNDWDTNTDKPLHRVGRYKITSPSNGASHIKLLFHSVHGGGDVVPLRYYFGTDPESHANAGPDAAYDGTLTWNGGEYSHTADADVTLVPNQTYYLWIFPGSDEFGWFYGYRTTYDSELTLSGSAMTDITASNGTLGTEHTVNLTRYGSTMTHALTAKCGTESLTIASGVKADTVEWTPPLDWAAQNTTGTTVPVTITCTTYSGSTKIGSRSISLTFAVPASVKPGASITTSDTKGYFDTYGSYIQGKSQVKVEVAAEGIYGSAVKSCVITCGSQTATGTGGTFSLPTSGKVTVKAVVTDSRGRITTETATIMVAAYAAPMAQITSAYRCDADGNENGEGEYGTVVFNGKVTSLDGKNEADYTLKYRVRGTSTWTSIAVSALAGTYAPSGASQVFPASLKSVYEVCIVAKDAFESTESTYRVIPASFVLMQSKRSISAISFGAPAMVANAAAFSLKVLLNKGVKLTPIRVSGFDKLNTALDPAVSNLEDGSMDFQLFQVSGTYWYCILFKEDGDNAVAALYSCDDRRWMVLSNGVWGPVIEETVDLAPLEEQISLLQSRISELAKLEQGSTTGDAELADVRVCYDGTTFDTAGNAVRYQSTVLYSALYDNREEYLVPPQLWESMTLKSDSANWVSSRKYKRGTVKGISLYILGDEAQAYDIMFCKDNGNGTASWYDHVAGSGVGLIDVECDIYMDTDFYVVVKAPNCAYREVSDGKYYAKSVSSGTFTIPGSESRKFYHAYSLHMAPFVEEKVDKDTFEKAAKDITNKTLKVAETIIRYGTEYADVAALPPNRIYSIHRDVDNETFGLPAKGYGTLLKYRPYADDTGDTGYDVYDFVVLVSGKYERYYAYGLTGHTASSLAWQRLSTDLNEAEILNETLKVAESTIRTGTEYADVVALPCNRIYSIHNDVDPASFGHPAKGHGTLMKYRPYTDDKGDTGYVVYEHTVYRSAGMIEKYFAYAIAGDTVDTLVWKKLNTTDNAEGIQKLGLEDKSIVFIGDSIVEGYGSSDYNGGESGTSGHLIENNVKTWYRNTGSKCWVNRMIAYLTEHYPGVSACNNGIGGFNVSNVLNNLETLTLDDSGSRADVVVLSVGTNARNYADKYGGITVPLRKIIHWLQLRGIQPIVLTNSPLYNTEDSLHAGNESNARCVRSAIVQACEEMGVRCYDLLSRYYEYLWEHDMEVSRATVMADPLHPNDRGYEIMFHLIKQLLHV